MGGEGGLATGGAGEFCGGERGAVDGPIREVEREFPAPEQGGHPGLGFFRITVGRGILEGRVAEAEQVVLQGRTGVAAGGGGAQGGDDEVEGALGLAAAGRPELGGFEERRESGADLALGFLEGGGDRADGTKVLDETEVLVLP